MIHVVRYAAFALALSLFICAAAAQEARWSHPGGRYSLDMSGLHAVPPTEDQVSAWTLEAEPQTLRMCDVTSRYAAMPSTPTQDQLNARVSSTIPPAEDGNVVEGFSVRSVDGVAVWRYTVLNAEAGFASYHRVFLLPVDGGAAYHSVTCGGVAPFELNEQRRFDAFLDSLRFSQ